MPRKPTAETNPDGVTSTRVDTPGAREKKARSSYRKTILPAPKSYSMVGETFFSWLKSFNEEQRARLQVHCYREWPVIDRRLIGEKKEKLVCLVENPESESWIFLDDPKQFILENQEWGGSGKYKLMATEVGVPGCQGMTKLVLQDSEFPPRIDVRTLVVGHPENKGYIETLRVSRVRLPGDDPLAEQVEREEEEEMNVAQPLVEGLLRQNERLTEELKEKNQSQAKPGDSIAETMISTAATAGFDVMAKAVDHGMDIVATQAKAISTASAPQYNPVDLFRAGIEAAGAGRASDSSGTLEVVKMFIDLSQRQHDQMVAFQREQMDRLEKIVSQPESNSESGGETVIDKFNEFKTMAEMFGWKKAGAQAETTANPSGAGFFDKVAKFFGDNPAMLVAGAGLLANIVYNMRAKEPISPDKALHASGAAAPAGLAQPNQTQTTASATTPAQPTAQQQLNAFLDFLTPHFLNHYMNQELDGYTFAADLHTMIETQRGPQIVAGGPATPVGRQQYEAILKAGAGQFDQIIRGWQPIWGVIANSPHTPSDPARYKKFFEEFFGYDAYARAQAGEPSGPSKVTTMRPQ